uniref:Uncharacterized protein n=1 Tax=Chlorocebus sabaeus TaxID=60711 RepID=A0A0D9RBB9_CHLSB
MGKLLIFKTIYFKKLNIRLQSRWIKRHPCGWRTIPRRWGSCQALNDEETEPAERQEGAHTGSHRQSAETIWEPRSARLHSSPSDLSPDPHGPCTTDGRGNPGFQQSHACGFEVPCGFILRRPMAHGPYPALPQPAPPSNSFTGSFELGRKARPQIPGSVLDAEEFHGVPYESTT